VSGLGTARPRAIAYWGPAPTVIARVRGEHLLAAEPPRPLGGTGVPTPIEYTLAALAACIAALSRRVSKERGASIESLEVEVEAAVDLRELTGEVPRAERKGLHDVVIHVKARGIPAREAEAIVEEAMSRCPIANALKRQVSIEATVEAA